MNIIDISQIIQEDMQVYPGDPIPLIENFLIHKNDYCHVNKLILGSHTGTHIDAPYHFFNDGQKITEFPLQKFIGEGIVIDVSGKKEEEMIYPSDLEKYCEHLKNKFALFYTGWDIYFNSNKYLKHPFLAKECAELLVESGASLVGIDALNVDGSLKEEYPVHNILLKNNILIVENLTKLLETTGKAGLYSFLPLKIKDADGSPIRAVFIEQSQNRD